MIFFTILPFPEKFLDFHPPKILLTFFLVIDHKFRISPYFRCFSTFPPCLAKIILSPPTLTNFSPVLNKFTYFLHTLRVFFPPTLTMMHLCITQCTYWTPLFALTPLYCIVALNCIAATTTVLDLHCT